MIPSDPYRPRDPAHGTPAWIKAILSTAILVLALAFLLAAVGMSEGGSSASSGSSPDTTSPPPPTPATAGMPGSTSTPSPPLVVLLATETPYPTREPKPTMTPRPECPDNPVAAVHCWKAKATATPGPTPTVAVAPTPPSCAEVTEGSCIAWPRIPGE